MNLPEMKFRVLSHQSLQSQGQKEQSLEGFGRIVCGPEFSLPTKMSVPVSSVAPEMGVSCPAGLKNPRGLFVKASLEKRYPSPEMVYSYP